MDERSYLNATELFQILEKFLFREVSKLSRLVHLEIKVHSSCLIKCYVKHAMSLFNPLKTCIAVFILREQGLRKGLILSYQKGIIRSYFQSPKKRGHAEKVLTPYRGPIC